MSENNENTEKQEESKVEPKPSLHSLSQTHGKLEDFKPTTLDQVWGDSGTWRYSTMDESEYRGSIEQMPKSDLRTHAQKIGLIPIDDRVQLTKRLVIEFRRHVSTYRMRNNDATKSKPLSKEAEKILKEGR